MGFGVGESFILIVVFAVICKSSLYIWQYWLPVAIEGPTPVSSLLHSSTMVVARVYLMILLPVSVPVFLVILLLALNMVAQIDVKKNIAYSTSIHLVLIVLFSIIRMYSTVVVYIILHRMVKRQLFQSSRYEIHRVRSQDIRKFNMNGSSMLMLIAIFILSALVRMVIMGSKELIVLGIMSVMVLFIIIVSIVYTLMYASKLTVVGKFGENEGFYVIFIIFISMILVEVNFRVWVSLLVFRVVIGVFYGNSIITVL